MRGVRPPAILGEWLTGWYALSSVSAPFVAIAILLTIPRSCPKPNDRFCDVCGYDLIGNVSRICPECGTGIGKTG